MGLIECILTTYMRQAFVERVGRWPGDEVVSWAQTFMAHVGGSKYTSGP